MANRQRARGWTSVSIRRLNCRYTTWHYAWRVAVFHLQNDQIKKFLRSL